MSRTQFNDAVRAIITDVETFLDSIKNVSLSKNAADQKVAILQKIDALRIEHPSALPSSPRSTTLYPPDEGSPSGNSLGSIEESPDGNPVYSGNTITADDLSAYEAVKGSAKSGFLQKRRKAGGTDLLSKVNPYQKRYCVIKNNIFYYYEKPTDKIQKGAFHLAGYEFREAPFQVKDVAKKELSFQLLCQGGRLYEFLAITKDDMQEWKNVVEKAAVVVESTPEHPVPETDDIYEPIEEHSSPPERPKTMIPENISGRSLPPVPKRVVPDSSKWKIGVTDDYANMYYCKWDCAADEKNELTFKQGDIIHVLSKEFDTKSWWVGEMEGKIGLVPKLYLSEAYERVM